MAMIDMLERSQQWLAEKITGHASRQILYRRGERQIFVLAAIGVTYISQFAGDGIAVKTEVRDYLIDVTALKIDGEVIEPQRGDRIIEIFGDVAHHFEVLPIGEQREWRYSDPYRNKFRIHTKSMRFAEPIRPELAIRKINARDYLASGERIDLGGVAVVGPLTLQIFNAGTAPLVLGELTLPDALTLTNSFATTLDIGETTGCSMQLDALALTPGPYAGAIELESNDPQQSNFGLLINANIGADLGTAEIESTLIVA